METTKTTPRPLNTHKCVEPVFVLPRRRRMWTTGVWDWNQNSSPVTWRTEWASPPTDYWHTQVTSVPSTCSTKATPTGSNGTLSSCCFHGNDHKLWSGPTDNRTNVIGRHSRWLKLIGSLGQSLLDLDTDLWQTGSDTSSFHFVLSFVLFFFS